MQRQDSISPRLQKSRDQLLTLSRLHHISRPKHRTAEICTRSMPRPLIGLGLTALSISSMCGFLHIAPLLVFKELQQREKQYRKDHELWFDAPAHPSHSKKLIKERADALKSRVMHYQLGSMDREGELPTLTGKLKVDWIDFPLDDILKQLTTLKEGILPGVFWQKAAAAWFGCRAEKAQITVLLPGGPDVNS